MSEFTPRFGEFVGPWRPAFAWLPVRLYDDTWIWLRRYIRRRVQPHDYISGPSFSCWWNDVPALAAFPKDAA